MDDLGQKSLEFLYKMQKDKKIALNHAINKNTGKCEECREIQDLKTKLAIIDWLIGAAIKAV